MQENDDPHRQKIKRSKENLGGGGGNVKEKFKQGYGQGQEVFSSLSWQHLTDSPCYFKKKLSRRLHQDKLWNEPYAIVPNPKRAHYSLGLNRQ